jgi:hypothetical protein
MQADVVPMDPITIQQYNAIPVKTTQGRPQFWCADGLSTVYLYPVASANVLSVVTRKPFTQFADLDTAYTLPSGYQGAFSATLAVAMAPALIGKVSADLMARERSRPCSTSRRAPFARPSSTPTRCPVRWAATS